MKTRPLAALLCLLALAACGRVHGVLTPTGAQAPGTSRVDMLVATTRSDLGAAPGEMFTGERGEGLSFADIAISIPPDSARQIGDVQFPQSLPADPLRDFVTLKADRLSKGAALAQLNGRLAHTPRRQVLVFVHGFNNRFEDAVYRFAQIIHDSNTDALPVLFTWPSRGKLLQYGYDHESASFSRDALERVLQALAQDPSVGEISVLAHSMGNWVTIEALRQMAIRDRGLPAKINTVMLAAPDVDFDVFQRQIAEIGSAAASRFYIFVARDDGALAVSRRVWGDMPRLGAINPEASPYNELLEQDKIRWIDLTGVSSDDPLRHGTFASAPGVVRAIGVRLAGGQSLAEAPGIGARVGQAATGAVGAVGAAAGAAVAAPFVLADPESRDNFGDNLGRAGAGLGDALGAGALTGR
ncbi:alpha/beta hydrolase [Methylocystis bryophila]|uniref:Esterase n=1 Tax=Methylocystis bryophila TaxID=655015 RepID=A0A1W6MR45_9HYPH|nr:alpha/beta hydrolase [Methylocystis bryophila]ARN80016.1 esterase [Methylocystis bryophila]BDV39927.1 esterase [Methylocystis bryophila]